MGKILKNQELENLILKVQKTPEAADELIDALTKKVEVETEAILAQYGQMSKQEDCIQEAYIKIWRQVPNYKPQTPCVANAWVSSIIKSVTIDAIRPKRDEHLQAQSLTEIGRKIEDNESEESKGYGVIDYDIPDVTWEPEQTIEIEERNQMLKTLVEGLSEKHYQVVIAKHIYDMSEQEIAEEYGIPVGTVKSRYNAAKKIMLENSKKMNYTFRAVAPMTIFMWLFRKNSTEASACELAASSAKSAIASSIKANASNAISAEASNASGSAFKTANGASHISGSAATKTAASGAAGAKTGAAKIVGKIAALNIKTKIIAAVVAGSVTIGGVAAAVNNSTDNANMSAQEYRETTIYELTDAGEALFASDTEALATDVDDLDSVKPSPDEVFHPEDDSTYLGVITDIVYIGAEDRYNSNGRKDKDMYVRMKIVSTDYMQYDAEYDKMYWPDVDFTDEVIVHLDTTRGTSAQVLTEDGFAGNFISLQDMLSGYYDAYTMDKAFASEDATVSSLRTDFATQPGSLVNCWTFGVYEFGNTTDEEDGTCAVFFKMWYEE